MDYSNHVAGFTKLFQGLIHSTVWREDMHVKVVWITMMAMADRHGHVLASLPGLADAARVTVEQCEDALSHLGAPDTHSRTWTPECEGRRIEKVDGGWRLWNYLKYRNLRDDIHRREQVREAVARHRAKKSDVINDVIISDYVSHGKPKQKQKQKQKQSTEAEEKIKTVSSEAESSPPSEPAVLTFPVIGSKTVTTWILTEAHLTEWGTLYPNLDVLAECRKALGWVGANPARRKTARGMPRFLVGWFSRAVDRGSHDRRGQTGSAKTAGNRAALEQFIAERKRMARS